MTHRLLLVIFLTLSILSARADEPERYFPYPNIPESLNSLQTRSDYLLEHFWDACNLQTAFSAKAKMAQAFADYATFIPLGSREVALSSIDKLLKKLEKQPNDLVFIAELAEDHFYGDSAEVVSDEAFLPFAKAVAANKKVDKANKLRFARKAKILENNLNGSVFPELPYITREGENASLPVDTSKVTIVYINDPDCDDCRLARIRLDANLTANKLIDAGLLRILSVTPDEPTDGWKEAVAKYPEKWTVAAAPDGYDILDIRYIPSFYILDEHNKIVHKNLNIEALIQILSNL